MHTRVLILCWIAACACTGSASTEQPVGKTNFIIVLVDDMGFSDLGSYGGEIRTPNIDQMTGNKGLLGYKGQLKKNAVTIAEVLKSNGYQTGMVGKWHVSRTNNSTPGHVMDLMATCLDIAGIPHPLGTFKNQETIPLEGKSLYPTFREGSRKGHRSIFFEHYYSRALCVGDWKLVSLPLEKWQLYNLSEDRTELDNLAEQYPEKLEELKTIYEGEAKGTWVYPAPEIPGWLKKNVN